MKTIFHYLQRFWTASIRRQLMLGIILVHAVLMSIFVYDLVERQRVFLHLQSVEQAKSLSSTLAANSVSWVLANDVIGLEETVKSQVNYPSLRYAMVLSPEGRVLAHTDMKKVGLYINDAISGKLLTTKQQQTVLVDDLHTIDVASPITTNGKFIGWARVNLTQKDTSTNLQVITRDGLIYTFLAIVIGALFAFFMARGITKGLNKIVEVAEGVKKGDQKLRADTSRHDEIGKLGLDLNIMLDTISKSKRDLLGIMDNSPAIIYVKDLNGKFTFVNKQFEKLFHQSRESIIGKSLFEVFPRDIADEMQRNDQDVLETGRALESEEHAPQDGNLHTYTSIKFPLYDDNESIYAVCGISTDITERRKMEKEKSSLEHQLIHAQKMQTIGQLAGGIAHDFNNLLAIILGYTELCQTKFANENDLLTKYLDEIYIAGSRGRELISQMMMFSRKDQDNEPVVPMKLETTIKETINMLTATFPATINFHTSFGENVSHVKGNSALISQIVMNLCINAKHSMDNSGDIDISIKERSYKNQNCNSCHENFSGDYAVINIKDSGHGISEEILERIFEPFFTSKSVGEGTGMGLSVVHGVVHKLGGHIIVTSKVGSGTDFEIVLPISEQGFENKERKKTDSKHYDFSDLSIMIVDDEPAVAIFLEEILEKHKAKVKTFTDSQQAFEYFESKAEKIDIVITDQTMPKLTGIALSQKLLELRPDISIIICTGYSTDVTEESVVQLGIKALLSKPVNTEKLYNIINELK